MDDKLLVRLYNVGLGDCIYLRIPDSAGARHVLIDCGNKFGGAEELTAAVEDFKKLLPAAGPKAPGKKRLDLLVATHSHEDHIRGFEAQRFADLMIDRIWLSVAMDPEHPQAEKMRALEQYTQTALSEIGQLGNPALSELAASFLSLSKGEGLKALREDLPKANKIKPLYVHAQTEEKALRLFQEEGTRFRVLAPMADIDGFYLGREFDALDNYLGFSAVYETLAGHTVVAEEGKAPTNISATDFERLKTRLQCNALAFALEEGHLVNNTSVVLLLEWRERRLLFTGDAEVNTAHQGEFRKGKCNGSWNVLWAEQKSHLNRPVDFLKVGHHGSGNATPWTAKKHPINAILDTLLPRPAGDSKPVAKAVVSTERSGYKTIPSPALMEELGRRVGNRSLYEEPRDSGYFVAADVLQPQRTDLEWQVGGEEARRYVDVTFAPA